MLTTEQQHALDALFTQKAKNGTAVSPAPPGFLQTWLGLSDDQLKGYWQDLLQKKDSWETEFQTWTERYPIDAAFGFLGASAVAFYAAERDINPKIKTYIDAFYYIATCASVGYADIFAVTQKGKTIAALVMIVGPSLAAKALDRPKR
jgi:hypothetical protein